MAAPVTAVTTGFLTALSTGLALRVANVRFFNQLRGKPLLYGNGTLPEHKPEDFEHKVRAHGNTVEFSPMFLLALGALEINKYLSQGALIALAAVFAAGRTSHSVQLAHPKTVPLPLRVAGFTAQIGVFTAASIILVVKGIRALRK